MKEQLPERLAEIVEDFEILSSQEKIEYLLQFSEALPALPERLTADRATLQEVHECMTPVFIHAECQMGRMFYAIDVPEQAPTVRGFAGILLEGANGLPPEQVLVIPAEFYLSMGLQHILTAQRMNGFGAILAHMKKLAAEQLV